MRDIKVKKVINAYGKMTVLGGSILAEEITEAMKEASSNFYEMKNVSRQLGKYISQRLNVEETMIVSSASSGLSIAVGACIAKNSYQKIMHPYSTNENERKVVLMKGHNINYGTSIQTTIELGGGIIVEAGSSNLCTKTDLISVIDENTKAIIFVKSHHCVQKGMLDLEEVVAIAKEYQLPVIVDAAAEGDLLAYYNKGADMVIYSGTKALEGPTSGLIVARSKWIEYLHMQNEGIGRILKIGKENMFGLVEAIDQYLNAKPLSIEEQKSIYQPWVDAINQLKHVTASFKADDAGRAIVRIKLSFKSAKEAKRMAELLKDDSEVSVYTRNYHENEGYLELDLRAINQQAFDILFEQLKKKLVVLNEETSL